MTLSTQARDVLIRAGKTFVQTALPTGAVLYSHVAVSHTSVPVSTVEAGALGAASAALSVLWNGSSAILGARRAKQLTELAAAIDAAVAARVAVPAPAVAAPVSTPLAPVSPPTP